MKIQIQLGPDRSRLHPMTRLRMERDKTYTVDATPDIHRGIAAGDFVRVASTSEVTDHELGAGDTSEGGQ